MRVGRCAAAMGVAGLVLATGGCSRFAPEEIGLSITVDITAYVDDDAVADPD